MIPILPKPILALPEIILAVTAMTLMMVGAFRRQDAARACLWLGILGLVAAAWALVSVTPPRAVTFHGQFVSDYFGLFICWCCSARA